MESTDIKKYRESLDARIKCYKTNFAYANGKNPTILTENKKKDPDNRIPIPLAKMAVTDMSGYAGRAGDTTVKILDDGVNEVQRKEYEELILSIANHNETDLETAELYEEALTQGLAYELFWTSDDLEMKTVTPEYKIVSALEIVPIYTSSLKPELSHAIRFWKVGDTEYADVYEPLFVTHYIKKETEEEYKLLITDDNKTGITEYPYKTVPLAVYPINRHTVSLFDAEKPIIDAHDNLISKSCNEIDRFNAMKLLFGGRITKEMADKIAQMNIFTELGDDKKSWPQYLEKNLGGIETFYNSLADRLERNYHKSIKIPDMTSEAFAGGSQSGKAIAYKLIGMEFKASQIDTYFDQGINKRIELINDVLETSYSYVNDVKYKITHKRNLPIDEAAKVELALKLKGHISDEAYFRMFPRSIIGNVQEELDRLEETPDKELLELFVLALNSGNKVPAQLVADALKIDRTEWLRLSTEEQAARIKALTVEDDNIESDINNETEIDNAE